MKYSDQQKRQTYSPPDRSKVIQKYLDKSEPYRLANKARENAITADDL